MSTSTTYTANGLTTDTEVGTGVLANAYREDLKAAGLGSGRHAFTFTPPAGLDFEPHAVEVRRSLDGASLEHSRPASLARRNVTVHRCAAGAASEAA